MARGRAFPRRPSGRDRRSSGRAEHLLFRRRRGRRLENYRRRRQLEADVRQAALYFLDRRAGGRAERSQHDLCRRRRVGAARQHHLWRRRL